MTRVEVGPADAFGPGERRIVEVGQREIGVFNVDGELHAMLNRCAHQGGPVCTGKLLPGTAAEYVEPGRRVEEHFTDELVVKCPWHGWEYRLNSGELVEGGLALPTYDVVVEDGTVYVEL